MIIIGKLLPWMVALLIDRPRIRTGYGLLERRGLRRVGVINRIGGNVRGSVHLSGLGLGTHSASPPDVGLPATTQLAK